MSQDIFSQEACNSQSKSRGKRKKNKHGNIALNFEMMEGKRRGSKLLHSIDEKQLYSWNKRLADGSTAFRCTGKNCATRVYLLENKLCYYSDPIGEHNHANKETEIKEIKLLATIKEQCAQPQASQTTAQIAEVREIFETRMLR